MITCTRTFTIDAGHRLRRHESQCRNVHGHTYKFEVTVSAAELDDVGRVIDFSVLKVVIGQWLLDNWDHGFIVEEGDPIIPFLEEDKSKHFIFPRPPTAENLARFLFDAARILMPSEISIESVVCWETPNCRAEYRLEPSRPGPPVELMRFK